MVNCVPKLVLLTLCDDLGEKTCQNDYRIVSTHKILCILGRVHIPRKLGHIIHNRRNEDERNGIDHSSDERVGTTLNYPAIREFCYSGPPSRSRAYHAPQYVHLGLIIGSVLWPS